MWKLNDGTIIRKPQQVTINNIIYPKTIFTLWSVEKLNSVGITPVVYQEYDKSRYKVISTHEEEIDGVLHITYELEEDVEYLGKIKKSMCDDINDKREIKMSEGVEYLGYMWDSDNIAKTNVMGTLLAYTMGVLPPEFVITWRTKDNSNVELTRDQLVGLSATILSHVENVYSWSWSLKDNINKCNSVEEIKSILNLSGE